MFFSYNTTGFGVMFVAGKSRTEKLPQALLVASVLGMSLAALLYRGALAEEVD